MTAPAGSSGTRPAIRSPRPVGSASVAARSGPRSREITAHRRQTAPTLSVAMPAYTTASIACAPNRSLACTAQASRPSSITPRAPNASAVALSDQRRSSEATTIVARVMPPMMSARIRMSATFQASTRKKIAATPTSETPRMRSSTGTVSRRRGGFGDTTAAAGGAGREGGAAIVEAGAVIATATRPAEGSTASAPAGAGLPSHHARAAAGTAVTVGVTVTGSGASTATAAGSATMLCTSRIAPMSCCRLASSSSMLRPSSRMRSARGSARTSPQFVQVVAVRVSKQLGHSRVSTSA